MTIKNEKNLPKVDTNRCSGCGRCVAACPERIITLQTIQYRKHAVITRPERCTGCGACVSACPIEALKISYE